MAKKKASKISHFHLAILVLAGLTFIILVSQLIQQQPVTTDSQAAGVGRACNQSCERDVCRNGLKCMLINGKRLCRNPKVKDATNCDAQCPSNYCSKIGGTCVCSP